MSPTLLMSESLWLPHLDQLTRCGPHKSRESARQWSLLYVCLLVEAALLSKSVNFLAQNRGGYEEEIEIHEVLYCRDISACATVQSTVRCDNCHDVKAGMSAILRWCLAGAGRVVRFFGVGVRKLFSTSLICTIVLRCMMCCQVVHALLIWVLLIEHLVGRHTLKATLRTGASVSPGERVACWELRRVVLSTPTASIHTGPSSCTARQLVRVCSMLGTSR